MMSLGAMMTTLAALAQPFYPHYGGSRHVTTLDGDGWLFGFDGRADAMRKSLKPAAVPTLQSVAVPSALRASRAVKEA